MAEPVELKRSIFVTFGNGGSFQFTRDPDGVRWLQSVTAPDGTRWIYGYVTRERIDAAIEDGIEVWQYD